MSGQDHSAPKNLNREEVLLHLISHGAYHRGNVGHLSKSIAIAPPRDPYTNFLHVSEPARSPGDSLNREDNTDKYPASREPTPISNL
ncbi:MAG: hypothetical protein H0W47_09780 [Polaromonas sp.]|uniref:DinB family protein n=1 Tax=Polaromonas sp. TaxID=1869339 RepID=UPI001805E171|nr:DinB family protein [Polaromonas sp.]MBA3594071.1 hypothetical protein [Polaromonas sp.]